MFENALAYEPYGSAEDTAIGYVEARPEDVLHHHHSYRDAARRALRPDHIHELEHEGTLLGRIGSRERSMSLLDFYHSRNGSSRRLFETWCGSAQERQDGGSELSKVDEWLMDNQRLIEEAFAQVEADIRNAPKHKGATARGTSGGPSAIDIVSSHLARNRLQFDGDRLLALVDGFQQVGPLKTRALWQIPFLLRLVLLDHLGRALEDAWPENALWPAGAMRLSDNAERSAAANIALFPGSRQSEDFPMAVELVEAIVSSLRDVDTTDWTSWVGSASRVDRALAENSNFLQMDPETRARYSQAIEDLSLRAEKSESEVALQAVELAGAQDGGSETDGSDIGHFLIGNRRAELEKALGCQPTPFASMIAGGRQWAWLLIPVAMAVMTFLSVLGLAGLLAGTSMPQGAWVALLVLAALPASEGAFSLLSILHSTLMRPGKLPGYAFSRGIPAEARTLVVIPCVIGSREEIDELVRSLELHYLSNGRGDVHFALLSDWPDAQDGSETAHDRALLDYAKMQIDQRADKYRHDRQTSFALLHRRRISNPAEGVWMGWERKRGKLRELNRLLRDYANTSYMPGFDRVPDGVQYVVTLDADTRLTPGAVARLVGKIHHPLNRPVVDEAEGRVTSGYSILQPRVTPSFGAAGEGSVFQTLCSVGRGLDPYVFTVSDVYQDLAGQGTFTGKGIYHVDAFEAALGDKVADNSILSHDLLEGEIARCALVSDVEFVEDFPARYQVDASRHHRWTRGDWQLLSWLFMPDSGVMMLGRWKILDNLRRSLVPIGWVGASITGWIYLDNPQVLLLEVCLTLFLFASPLVALIRGLAHRPGQSAFSSLLRHAGVEIATTAAFLSLRIALLAHQAIVSVDAIARALYRSLFSGRKMLEWRTAAQVGNSFPDGLWPSIRSMWTAPALVAVFAAGTLASGVDMPSSAYPLLTVWFLSPVIAWLVGRARGGGETGRRQEHARLQLGIAGRRTWRYFESFVTPERHHLPPDNFQEAPRPVVAERTSPTNIGVYLLATVSAYQAGWIGMRELVARLDETLSTVEELPRYRGHLFNWYGTDTLEPLSPRYVSSVDSGNLAGHLIAVSSACRNWAKGEGGRLDRRVGLGHVVGVIDQVLDSFASERIAQGRARQELKRALSRFSETLAGFDAQRRVLSVERLSKIARKVEKLARADLFPFPEETGRDLVHWAGVLVANCLDWQNECVASETQEHAWHASLADIASRARTMALAMDFAFLVNPGRQLLSIGFNVETGLLDEPCYDLLASEARLTSFLAVAKGDLPADHWRRLGRPVTSVRSVCSLLSWSGSMFEYLMPSLVMHEPAESILGLANRQAIRGHVDYARRLGLPWGISEAAYNVRDRDDIYQYSGFGVPALGLKRGLDRDAVVAPYASLLASQFVPALAVENLDRLADLGARGRYGYYDSVDFTRGRAAAEGVPAVVRNYMAHHQGMSIAAVANAAFDGLLRDWFHADPLVQAMELILHEKPPVVVPKRQLSRRSSGARGASPRLRFGLSARVVSMGLRMLGQTFEGGAPSGSMMAAALPVGRADKDGPVDAAAAD